MIPEKLDSWNIQIIKAILSMGVFENDLFDLKEKLPDPRDEQGKERIKKTSAAFANSNGGFLVFGVKDSKGLDLEQRLVGIDKSFDFPERFGAHVSHINPSIEWEFLNPPIDIGHEKVIHVVRVNCNYAGPHSLQINNINSFPKRTNRGNEEMSYLEIKMAFLNFYERKIKINLLTAELYNLSKRCVEMQISTEQQASSYSLVTLNGNIIESLLPEIYLIIANDLVLLENLSALRGQLNVLENKCRIFYSAASMPLTDQGKITLAHNQFVQGKIITIHFLANQIASMLNKYRV